MFLLCGEKRRRLSRAYADGAFSDAEYEVRLGDLDAHLQAAAPVTLPTLEHAAELFAHLPRLWRRASNDERMQLVQPLVDRVFIDLESKRIGGIQPTPEFHELLELAVRRKDRSASSRVSTTRPSGP